MTKAAGSAFVVVSLGAVVTGCATQPVQTAGSYASEGVHATYHAATASAYVVSTTSTDLYHGAGRAIRQPLHDLNMVQEKIPPVLLRAESRPYDLTQVNSCNDVLDKVAELDLALGPDVDTPKEGRRTRASRGADFAAEAALDAAGSAAEHFIPMRGTIKQLTGAQRYENHVRHAVLSGEVRRSFLKAVGMQHNCSWPAAPLDFKPDQVADASASWSGPQVASAAMKPSTPTVRAIASAPAPAAQDANAPIRTAALASRTAAAPHTIYVSAQTASASGAPVFVPSYNVIALPHASLPPPNPAQAWQPPASESAVPVSAALTSTGAVAPWSSAAFVSAARP